MSEVTRVAGAAIVAAVCAMAVRRQFPEGALLLAVCAGVLVLLSCTGALESVTALLESGVFRQAAVLERRGTVRRTRVEVLS